MCSRQASSTPTKHTHRAAHLLRRLLLIWQLVVALILQLALHILLAPVAQLQLAAHHRQDEAHLVADAQQVGLGSLHVYVCVSALLSTAQPEEHAAASPNATPALCSSSEQPNR